MSIRIVASAGGALSRTFAWSDGTEVLTARQLIDVDPGSALETARRLPWSRAPLAPRPPDP